MWEQISEYNFSSCLDAFGGTGSVAYRLKQEGKQVAYNDLLRFNYQFGLALIENNNVRLNSEEINWILQRHLDTDYPSFTRDNFKDIYYTDEENSWIDQTITNIRKLENPYKFALAFFALCQACIIKRPYNLFHRKNLYLRFADVERSFGNKTTWDKPFKDWFRLFITEVNNAVFSNDQDCRSLNFDVYEVPDQYDLVYIDTPYITRKSVSVDYYWFYHFLEGLAMYEQWGEHIDFESKHRRLKPIKSDWVQKNRIHIAFDRIFKKFADSILVISYRSDGIPSEAELVSMLRKYKPSVRVEHFGQYKYVLSKNSQSSEILIIGY